MWPVNIQWQLLILNRKHVLIINLRKTLLLLYHYTIIKYERLFFLFQKSEEQQTDYIDFYGDRDQNEPKSKN